MQLMKLEVNALYKNFEDKEVLHGISFEATSGKALGLLGRNGAGKTTTIRILMDVFKASKGEILLDGKPFQPEMQQIGYLPEERGLYPKKKVSEQILYLAQLRGLSYKQAKENTSKWLNRLGIEDYANRQLETLSKGNQQKVQLAQALISDPEIVILDEPFSGLDPVNSQILQEVVKELIRNNKLVIFSSHQMSYVEEFCEEIAIMKEGNIVLEGNLKEIKRKFGANRLVLSASNIKIEVLEKLCLERLRSVMNIYDRKNEYLLIELQEGKTNKELLQALIHEDVEVDRFMMYEPSLTDIFVLKAGDEA